MPEHLFDIKIAKKYGVNAAIMVRHLQFWIIKNKANNKHFHDGRTWTYNSIQALCKIFPYWSVRQIRTILDNLENRGVILKANYSERKNDRTTWYAFTKEKVFVRIDKSICQNRQVDASERAKGLAETDRALSNPKPNNSTDEQSSQGLISRTDLLALDLQIADKKKLFLEQVTQILHVQLSGPERTTFQNIANHFVKLTQKDRKNLSVFTFAIEWARQAKCSNARNTKGLFVAMVKDRTGFKAQENLLGNRKQRTSVVAV